MKAGAAASILLGLLALAVMPARGQIASYVDERGKRVFINADPPAPRHNSLSARGADQRALRAKLGPPGEPGATRTTRRISKEGLVRMVNETAERHRVDPALVSAVVEAESNWNPFAVSSRGALGLMQLVPGTAERFGVGDMFNPEQNLEAGVEYLRILLERYEGDLNKALAAYNAGERAVDYARGVPNISETRKYVQKVTDSYFRPGSDRLPSWWKASRPIYREIDERGRVIFTNE